MGHCVEAETITGAYCQLLELIALAGEPVNGTLEVRNVMTTINDPTTRFILEKKRQHRLDYVKKEILWYLGASKSIKGISDGAKRWAQVSDDGKTVNSNYGYSIFKRQKSLGGIPQIHRVVDELNKNPYSRRVIMFFLLSHEIYAKMHTTKDFPCTIYAQFFLRNQRKLDMSVYMRSNDLIWGWCNDIPFFSVVQEIVAAYLGAGMGQLTHTAGSLHLYDRHKEKMKYEIPVMPMDAFRAAQVVFPPIEFEELDDILRLKPCRFVDFLRQETNYTTMFGAAEGTK